MIYLALTHGATGISWWISPSSLEAVLSQTALEVARFSSRRLGSLPSEARSNHADVRVSAWAHADGGVLVLAVNGRNQKVDVAVSGPWAGKQGRWEAVVGAAGFGSDLALDPFEVRVALWKGI